jgi:hypothetical protein
MLVPVYGFLRGDTLGLVVLVHDHQTVRELAASLQQAATCRVAPTTNARVWHAGRELDLDVTVAQAGITALDRVDVVPESSTEAGRG